MKLRDLLHIIQQVASSSGTSEAMICGGVPRDKLLKLISKEVSDLDITTGDKTIHNLAVEVSLELKKHYNISTKKGDDGHTSIIFPGNKFKLDFSSNFVIPHIDEYLFDKRIKNPTDMQREMFSRDFSCNALLMTLDLKKIQDPTNAGLEDIKKRILKTCLDTDTTFRYNPNRIIRTVYLASKLDFDVDPEIIKWISENKNLVRLSSDRYLITNIDKAMSRNPERAVHIINKTNLWDVIPITDLLRPYYGKKSVLKSARKKDDIDILKNNIGNYIHFSDSDRFGVSFHKDINPGNPRGLYGFPFGQNELNKIIEKKQSLFEDYGYKKYIYIFNVNGNIIDIDNINPVSVSKNISEFVLNTYGEKLNENTKWYIKSALSVNSFKGSDGQKLFKYIRQIANTLRLNKIMVNDHSIINVILRGIDWDALETNKHSFDDGIISQIVVLNPSKINLIAKINNPMLSKDNADTVKTAQLRRNYDYGEGLYMNLDKYKSVSDFRKKRRKKRVKELKKIKEMKLK